MERLHSPASKGYLVRPKPAYDQQDNIQLESLVSELGVFGTIIG